MTEPATPPSIRSVSNTTPSKKGYITPSRSIFSPRYVELLNEDVDSLKQAETRVLNLNDVAIALAKVIFNESSEVDVLKDNVARIRELVTIREKQLDNKKRELEKKKQAYQFADKMHEQAVGQKDDIKEQITSLRSDVNNLIKELEIVYKDQKIDTSSLLSEIKIREFTIEKLKKSIGHRKAFIEDCARIQAESQKEYDSLVSQEMDLQRKEADIKAKTSALYTREDACMKSLYTPIAEFSQEQDCADREDAKIAQLENLLETTPLDEFVRSVNEASSAVVELEKQNDDRRADIKARQNAVRVAKSRKAAPSRMAPSTTKYRIPSSMATSAFSPKQNQRLAMAMAQNIFAKLSQAQLAADEANFKTDDLEVQNKISRVTVEEEWHTKMEKIEEMTKELGDLEIMGFEIATIEKSIDEKKRMEMELAFELANRNRMMEIQTTDRKRNETRKELLKGHQTRINEKQDENNNREQRILAKKQEIEKLMSDLDKEQQKFREYEADVIALEKEHFRVEAKLYEVSAEANQLMSERASICQ